MRDLAHAGFGESGTDAVRFGGRLPAPEHCQLADAIPLLMRIEGKSEIGLAKISRTKLAQIMNFCAGKTVQTRASVELSSSILIDLEGLAIEISQDASGGLRDAIFAAVLLRVYHGEAHAACSFAALIDEARLTILDELPHAMGYSGSGELECTMTEDHCILLQTQDCRNFCVLPTPAHDKVLEHRAVTLHAA